MKPMAVLLSLVIAACSGGAGDAGREAFTVVTINKTTPVKQQGASQLCWVYAMLAVIECDRLALGDSVNLSADYVARHVVAEAAGRRYLSEGTEAVSADGVATLAIDALDRFGVVPFDAYNSECNYNVLCRRLTAAADAAAARRTGINRLRQTVDYQLDSAIRPLPRRVWMYGAEYTPHEFARSVCAPWEYVALTSYSYMPFFQRVVVGVPANRRGDRWLNIPIDTLVGRVTNAIASGRSVCWEGDITNPGFSFEKGVARLAEGHPEVTQAMRDRAFETFDVTDDHCMALIGLARDSLGRPYFICKNSWGTDNPYHGLMFMSEEYFRKNTIAVVMKR